MQKLLVGDKAPDFLLRDQNNNDFKLSDFKGKWVVVYFVSKNFNPNSLKLASDFNKLIKKFDSLGAIVVGVSNSSVDSNLNFINKINAQFSFLSDSESSITKLYSPKVTKQVLDREIRSIPRTTYLINPNGNVEFIWRNFEVLGHAEKVLKKISERRFLSRLTVL
ncbi:MAG TPA: peroxiredoxin [Fusobacteria bacterium]|nr:peroxiredoxin [Fusobacteriota bacterium]|tara:strand:+ start:1308 stop:1802 length:495 start_codon:yes stop_codon:yes gene_type:complete